MSLKLESLKLLGKINESLCVKDGNKFKVVKFKVA